MKTYTLDDSQLNGHNRPLLVVGAGGFIGGFISRRALQLDYDTWAGVRESTSRRYLKDKDLHFAVFDYEDTDTLRRQLLEQRPSSGRWDMIIWNLGATKCPNFTDFNRINYLYLKRFTDLLIELDMIPERMLFMSSLSALGPGDENTYAPLDNNTIPAPNTYYGVSKIKAETYLLTVSDRIPWIIFRPTGVYGPHEKDYLMMIKSIDSGLDVGMGYKRQMLTFVYVDDLVQAMFQALAAPAHKVLHHTYIISEDRAYTQKEFRDIVSSLLGKSMVMPLKLPMWMVYGVSAASEKIAALRGKSSTLNRDKFKIMKQRNWNCDVSPAKQDFGFEPLWSLEDGLRETVIAYLLDKKGAVEEATRAAIAAAVRRRIEDAHRRATQKDNPR